MNKACLDLLKEFRPICPARAISRSGNATIRGFAAVLRSVASGYVSDRINIAHGAQGMEITLKLGKGSGADRGPHLRHKLLIIM